MTSPQPGYDQPAPPRFPPPGRPPASPPWTRSSTDRVIAGVCGGLGRRLGVDPVILRVLVVVLSFFAGAGIVLYAAAWLFMPLDRTNQSVLSDALGSTSTGRTRSVLIAVALVGVVVIAAGIGANGGFVPGFLVALVVIGVLLLVRRDENAAAAAQSPYGTTTYGQPQYGRPPASAPEAAVASTTPSPYPSASASTEPTVVTGSGGGTEPTVVLGTDEGPGFVAGDPTLAIPRQSHPYGPTPVAAAYWEPPFDAPPPPPYMSQQGPPPSPPRERSYLGVLTVSAMIAVLGGMGVLDGALGLAVPLAAYLVAALAVVAGGLVLGAWVGRSRGLIALGIILGVAIGPAVLVDAVAGTEWRSWNNADNIRLAPQTPPELDPVYDYGAGSLRMDLTGLDFEGEELATMIDMGAGEIVVTVPADVDVSVNGSVVVGDLAIFDRQTSGFDASEAFTDLGADGLGGGRFDLSIDLGLGTVEVRREAS